MCEANHLNNPEMGQVFDLNVYLQAYYALRDIQSNIRNPNLIKSIKTYLELIATGRIDYYEFVRLPLLKKKILKLSFLYERVTVVIIAFAYASEKLVDTHRYLSNMIRYTISSYLVSLKILST